MFLLLLHLFLLKILLHIEIHKHPPFLLKNQQTTNQNNEMSQTRFVYKNLLREVERYQPTKDKAKIWKGLVRRHFQSGDGSLIQAKEYALLIKSVREQKELLTEYNIGTFVDERERLRRSSARVGLQLPNFAEDFENNFQKR